MGFNLGDIGKGVGDLFAGGLIFNNALRGLGGGGKGGGGGMSGITLPRYRRKNPNEFMTSAKNINIKGTKLAPTAFNTLDQANATAQTAMARRFDQARERTNQDFNAQRQNTSDALQRRFASMGGSNAGARLKLEQLANDENMRQRSDAMRGIDTEQEVAASQQDLQNAQMKAQLQSQYDLTQGQLDQQRNLAQADMKFKNRVFSFERGSKMHELDLAERQQQIDTRVTEFNTAVAAEQSKPPKQGMFSRWLGDFI